MFRFYFHNLFVMISYYVHTHFYLFQIFSKREKFDFVKDFLLNELLVLHNHFRLKDILFFHFEFL
jgi:hypothetical protein